MTGSPQDAHPDPPFSDLRRDLDLLRDLLERAIVTSGPDGLVDDVRRLRAATTALRREPTEEHRRDAERIVESLSPERAVAVARAFTVSFQLANRAEERHRIRVLRARGRRAEVVDQSLAEAVAALGEEGPEEVAAGLDRLSVELVLTAHPTEARRRAVVESLQRIAGLLARRDQPDLTLAAREHVDRRLLEEVSVLWQTEQIRPQRLSPLDEVRTAVSAFDHSIFGAVPRIYRELDRVLDPEGTGTQPPSFRPYLRWGSWVGGDRDGNPHVTAEVTRETLRIQSDHALRGLEEVTRRVGRAATVSASEVPPSEELSRSLAEDEEAFPETAAHLGRSAPDQPHRRKLVLAARRLAATRDREEGAYQRPADFLADVDLVQASLAAGGASRLAYGEVQHLRWQAEAFGFHLASLEVRQHSEVHAEVVEELLPGAADDAEALDRLATQGWDPPVEPRSDRARETLETFRVMAELQRRFGPEACRRYVVSFTRSPADVVAPAALARLAVPEGELRLDLVPLFESAAELRAGPALLDGLFALPGMEAWLEARDRTLELMLGYSDSTKEMGYLAANVALHAAQAELSAWAERRGVTLTLFHGRGGALGRGGGPAARAIMGQAAGSLRGRLKVTEQGEVVFARYANPPIALRHLEQVSNAVLLASRTGAEAAARDAQERYGSLVAGMAGAAEAAYRELVESPGFDEFFARVTPVDEVSRLRIGSRPARRAARPDLGSLRAIPWVFAWLQSRINLPGWFGLGTGLAAETEGPGGLDRLREMYDRWPFFRSLLENAEVSLVKADPSIARRYLALGERPDLRERIEHEYERTVDLVLRVMGQSSLLEDRPVLQRSVELRNPSIDALSLLQLRALRELRSGRGESARLALETLNGIAAGLQDTG